MACRYARCSTAWGTVWNCAGLARHRMKLGLLSQGANGLTTIIPRRNYSCNKRVEGRKSWVRRWYFCSALLWGSYIWHMKASFLSHCYAAIIFDMPLAWICLLRSWHFGAAARLLRGTLFHPGLGCLCPVWLPLYFVVSLAYGNWGGIDAYWCCYSSLGFQFEIPGHAVGSSRLPVQ